MINNVKHSFWKMREKKQLCVEKGTQTSIFIASNTKIGCPSSTFVPSFTRTFTTKPAMGATTVPRGPFAVS